MAVIVYISKYPPLEGGIASKTYWLANALARSGHTIHVVTDAVAVDTHLTISTAGHPPVPPGVFIHRVDQIIPWHIPNDSHREISLLDKALEVAADNKPDLIVGGYLVPYGVVASHLGRMTGIPFVLMHGGSDIQKFLLKGVWPNILPQIIAEAAMVVTDSDNQEHIQRFNTNIWKLPPYIPDPSVFSRRIRVESDQITLAVIGKANYHWPHKGWQRIIDIWRPLPERFRFVVVSQGIGIKNFKAAMPKALEERIDWLSFVPPWHMPELLHTFDGLLYFQGQLPFPMYSNTVLEALACGIPLLTDSDDILNGYRKHGIDFGDRASIIVISFQWKPDEISTIISNQLGKQMKSIAWDCSSAFNQYLCSIERIFAEMKNSYLSNKS